MLAFISDCFSSICLRLYVQENTFIEKTENTKNTEIKERKKKKKKKKWGGGGGDIPHSAIKYWKTCDFFFFFLHENVHAE